MAQQDSASYWSDVGVEIRGRRDGNRLAGIDAPYFLYKSQLMREKFLASLPVEGKSVLDVGCGAGGSLAGLLDRHPSRLAGCDQSTEMVKLSKEYVPDAEISVMDGEQLPYDDNEFDLVTTVTVLQHNPDDRRARLIAEISRVAKEYVFFIEDTANPRVSDNEGSDGHYFGRYIEWYSKECAKHGWSLVHSEALATEMSFRTFKLLRKALSRGRIEGQPLSRAHLAIERLTIPLTRRLDRVVPSRQWELTMMSFRPSAWSPEEIASP
jgi:ubiquinone/menaquinone biosynthesis C-methylase UbiE